VSTSKGREGLRERSWGRREGATLQYFGLEPPLGRHFCFD